MSTADLRGRLVGLWERAHDDSVPADRWPLVTALSGPALDAVPPGCSAWAVGPWQDDPQDAPSEGRHIVVMPSLVATGTGRCPLCGGVAGILPDSPSPDHPASWRLLPLRVGISHTPGCPAVFTDADRQFFDPRALAEGRPVTCRAALPSRSMTAPLDRRSSGSGEFAQVSRLPSKASHKAAHNRDGNAAKPRPEALQSLPFSRPPRKASDDLARAGVPRGPCGRAAGGARGGP